MSDMAYGYVTLGKSGDSIRDTTTSAMVTQPASGDTVVLWDSTYAGKGNVAMGYGSRYKQLVINNYSSAASATNGLSVEESNDGGTNWDVVATYTIAATTYTKTYVAVSAPEVRVRYVNSANALTAFRWSVLGDTLERNTGV